MKGHAADLRHGGVGANIQRSFRNERYLPGMDEFRPAGWSTPFVTVALTLICSVAPTSSACVCRCLAAAKPSGIPMVRPDSKPRSCVTACSSAMCPRSKGPRHSTSPRSLTPSPAPTMTARRSPAHRRAATRPRPYPRRWSLPPFPRRISLPVTRPAPSSPSGQRYRRTARAGRRRVTIRRPAGVAPVWPRPPRNGVVTGRRSWTGAGP